MVDLLIGNIASGKSTYARQRVREGWFVVNGDAIMNMLLADQYRYQNLVVCLMQLKAKFLVEAHEDVVIDSSWNVAAEARIMWQQLFPNLVEIVFPREAPEVHAKRRMEHDPRGGTYDMWLEVAQCIDSMY